MKRFKLVTVIICATGAILAGCESNDSSRNRSNSGYYNDGARTSASESGITTRTSSEGGTWSNSTP